MCQDPFKITQLELIKGHRREMPPATRAYREKKRNYERRDKSWRKEAQEVILERSYA
jgi:hypothetical protein